MSRPILDLLRLLKSLATVRLRRYLMYQELLRDLTESYLKSLIAEVSGALKPDFDSFAPFGELGIDSFHVLKIIKKLEGDFGVLPKSLLFENFNINDLADYFAGKHEQAQQARLPDVEPGCHRQRAEGHPVGTGGQGDARALPRGDTLRCSGERTHGQHRERLAVVRQVERSTISMNA